MDDKFYEKYIKYKTKYIAKKHQANKAKNQVGGDDQKSEPEKSLYDRLGGVYAIAAVVNLFSDEILKNSLVGTNSSNPDLKKWAENQAERLPGLKFMRTLWVCEITGGPFKFSATVPGACHMSLEAAHEKFHISPEEFDEVAKILKESMEYYKVPDKEASEVLGAFAAHKVDVTKGYYDKIGKPVDENLICPMGHK